MRAVFLDRDGVLTAAEVAHGVPRPAAEPRLLDGVPEACDHLSGAGFKLVMVTNQPDIARGRIDRATVDRINEDLRVHLHLDGVRVCPHDDIDACRCRKPQPGMLIDAAEELGLDLSRSVIVGDRWRDIDAGAAVGALTVFVDHQHPERRPERPDHTVVSLCEAVSFIIESGQDYR